MALSALKVPNYNTPVIDRSTGLMRREWYAYFQQLSVRAVLTDETIPAPVSPGAFTPVDPNATIPVSATPTQAEVVAIRDLVLVAIGNIAAMLTKFRGI